MRLRIGQSGKLGLLQDINLRRLWVSEVFSSAGESLGLIALPLLIYDMTDSAQIVGLVTLLLILPRVICAPITGLLADNMDRRVLMIAGYLLRAVTVGLVLLTSQVWQIAILTVFISIGNALSRPAEMAAIPAVTGGAFLVRALSLFQVTNGIIRIAIPAAGAALIAISGPKAIFGLQSIMYVFSMLAVRRLALPPSDHHESFGAIVRSARTEMWAGIDAVKSVPIVRGITATEALFQLVMGATVVAAVVYTRETLNLGDHADSAFALMATASSIGAVGGALIASRIEHRIGRRKMMAIGYLGPLFLTVAIFSPPMSVIYVAWLAFGFTDAMAVISFQAYLAEAIPANMRGRVYAAWGALVALAASLAFPIVGFLTSILGAPLTIAFCGLLVGLGGPFLLWKTGALESIRHHVPVADLAG